MSSILGPHGEGYCTVCRFIEPLGPTGQIEPHVRNVFFDPHPCPGGDRAPAPASRVPFFSRLSRFSTRVVKRKCHACGKRTGAWSDTEGSTVMPHWMPAGPGRWTPRRCEGSYARLR